MNNRFNVILLSIMLACVHVSGFFTSEERTFLTRQVKPKNHAGSVLDMMTAGTDGEASSTSGGKFSDIENTKMSELAMRGFEVNRFNEVVRDLVDDGYSIKGFYHTSNWQKHWQGIIEEQLEIMDGRRARLTEKTHRNSHAAAPHWASLLDVSTGLHMGVAGKQESFDAIAKTVHDLELRNVDKISMHRYDTIERFSSPERQKEELAKFPNVTSGEIPTMTELHEYCKREKQAGRKALVYYLHNKGGCCAKADNKNAGHWRDMMNAFVIEFPSICLRALKAGYSTCGPSYQDAHYSGNFWWATCDHVADLKMLSNPFDAHSAEFFVLVPTGDYGQNRKMAEICGYNPFHCGVNHYDFPCPRTRYNGVLLSSVSTTVLPPNPTHSHSNKTAVFIQETCTRLRALPPAEKRKWLDTPH